MTTPSVGPPGTFPGFAGDDFPHDDLYKCVHCGFCLNACPTYIETGLEAESPRGRLALMKAVNEGRLDITPQVVGHWDLCLQCRACEVACPSGVPYGRVMEATRESVQKSFSRPRTERIGRASRVPLNPDQPGQDTGPGRGVEAVDEDRHPELRA